MILTENISDEREKTKGTIQQECCSGIKWHIYLKISESGVIVFPAFSSFGRQNLCVKNKGSQLV